MYGLSHVYECYTGGYFYEYVSKRENIRDTVFIYLFILFLAIHGWGSQ